MILLGGLGHGIITNECADGSLDLFGYKRWYFRAALMAGIFGAPSTVILPTSTMASSQHLTTIRSSPSAVQATDKFPGSPALRISPSGCLQGVSECKITLLSAPLLSSVFAEEKVVNHNGPSTRSLFISSWAGQLDHWTCRSSGVILGACRIFCSRPFERRPISLSGGTCTPSRRPSTSMSAPFSATSSSNSGKVHLSALGMGKPGSGV